MDKMGLVLQIKETDYDMEISFKVNLPFYNKIEDLVCKMMMDEFGIQLCSEGYKNMFSNKKDGIRVLRFKKREIEREIKDA